MGHPFVLQILSIKRQTLLFINSCVKGLVVDRRVLASCLIAGYGVLPGAVPGSGGYLGREAFLAVIGRSRRNQKRKIFNGLNDVCNGVSIATDDRRSGAKPWTGR